MVCPICGQKLKLVRSGNEWIGERPEKGSEQEIRDRVDEYARLKGYVFTPIFSSSPSKLNLPATTPIDPVIVVGSAIISGAPQAT